MKNSYETLRLMLILVTLESWLLCMERPSYASEQTRLTQLAAEVKALESQDFGVLPDNQSERFTASILTLAANAGVQVMTTSKVTSKTNAFFCERRQQLNLHATQSQLLDFLGNVGMSNSVLRVRALALRPDSERTRYVASVAIAGTYRLKSDGQPQGLEPLEAQSRVLNERHALRYAALDCYNATKTALPANWGLDAMNFEGGKKVILNGNAPADQARVLEDLKAQLQKAKGRDSEELFQPSGAQATMRRQPDPAKNIAWSIELNLRQSESP